MGGGIVVYSSSGALSGWFLKGSAVGIPGFAWSPDSRYLAVASRPSPPSKKAYLAVIDLRTGKMRTIAHGWAEGLSFAPTRSDRLVYGLGPTTAEGTVGPPNLYEAAATGGPVKQLTYDGRSLNPLCGKLGIVFDHETPGTRDGLPSYPACELFLLAHGHATQITHMNVFWERVGLVPVAVSADGTRLAANWFGEDANRPGAST